MHSILISDMKKMQGHDLRHYEKLQLVKITLDYHLQLNLSNFQKRENGKVLFGLPKHSKAFTIWIDLIDLHINSISKLVLFHSKPLCTSYSFGKQILEFSPLQFFQKIFLVIFAIWTGKTSLDHERRRQTSSCERECHRPNAGVVA